MNFDQIITEITLLQFDPTEEGLEDIKQKCSRFREVSSVSELACFRPLFHELALFHKMQMAGDRVEIYWPFKLDLNTYVHLINADQQHP